MKKMISILLAASMATAGLVLPLTAAETEGFRTNLSNGQALNGKWTETDDGLQAKGDGDCFWMSDTVVSDFSYTAHTKVKGNGAVSLVFRSNESGSQAYVANVDLNRGDARLFKFPATGVFEFGSKRIDKSLREYTLRVDCVGNSIAFYVNGDLIVSATDASYPTGRLGLLIWSNDAVFQDVNYTPIGAADVPALTDLTMVENDDGIRFAQGISEFHGKLPYAQDAVELVAKASADRITVSAKSSGKTVLVETAVESGKPSPKIPLAVGVTEITYRMTRACPSVAAGEITTEATVLLRRCEEGETMKYDITYADAVASMTDLAALASPVQVGEGSGELSSYDRRSTYNEITGKYQNWDANDDHGDQLPKNPDGSMVLADLQGPGALVRFWSAEPHAGLIRIFIDGAEEPAVEMPFCQLFDGGSFPFDLPHISYDAARGKNCYLPIPYNESCKVVVYGDWGRYYQIGYVTYAEGTTVESFSLPLSAEGQQALLSAEAAFAASGSDGTVEKTVTVPAGGKVDLFTDSGAGAITAIEMQIRGLDAPGADWEALAELAISAYWDGEQSPSVWTTLGGFFGSVCGLAEYQSLPMGVSADGILYARWYMPYADGARLVLQNDGKQDYTVRYTVNKEALAKDAAEDLLRFHAKWNRLADPAKDDRFPDSPFLQVEGSGRFVGVSMHIYKEYGVGDPQSHPDWWWGEGDEKFFVDGEKFPSWFGTGSEDYFGYAWGSWMPFTYPYHAQPFTNGGMWGIGNRLNNRYHVLDNVPFTTSFEGYFEKYHRDGYSNQVVTAYFYLEAGQSDPYGAVSLEERRGYYDLPYPEPALFYEGEEMKILSCTGMDKAETQEMAVFGKGWSGGSQLIFKAGAGAYVKMYLNVPETAVYDLSAHFTQAGDFGIAYHYLDGEPLGNGVDLYNNGVIRSDAVKIGRGVTLTAGLHVLEVRIPEKNSRSSGYFYGLDCLELLKVGEAPLRPSTDEPPATEEVPPVTEVPGTPPADSAPDSGDKGDKGGSAALPIAISAAAALAVGAVAAVAVGKKKKK